MRTAFASMAWNTCFSSPGELEMICSSSEAAVCCSRASLNSRRRAATSLCWSAADGVRLRAAFGALLRFGLAVLRRRVFIAAKLADPSG